jgi:hypothetical protein
MIVCPCSLQALWWSSNMCLKINGSMPNATRGLSLKKSQPVIRERCKHEYTEIWNCLKPSIKGDTFVRYSTCQTDFSCVNGRRLDRLSDYRHIWNFSMKLRVKEKIRFIENWGLQIYRDCIILFSNALSLHLKQYMYDYWSIKLFSDILCDSPTTNKFQIVISKNPMLVIWIFFCTILNCTINILIYWELYMYLYYL